MDRLIELRDGGTVGDVLDHLLAVRRPRIPDALERRERQLREFEPEPGEDMPRPLKELDDLCDRFRLNELADCVNGTPLVPRVTRWSEASEDIRALRKMAADGPLSCEESSQLLVAASLSAALVKNDDQGSARLVKRGSNNTGRDDVAAALTLVAGAYMRSLTMPRPRWRYAGMVG